jgi:hypothetical protein
MFATARDQQPEFFLRNRIMTMIERFFRAGWEARGAADQAGELKRMME